jgi:hypothetical protein
MIKVEWLAAEILLILSSVGLVTGKICWLRICAFIQPMGIKGQLHALNKKKKRLMTK